MTGTHSGGLAMGLSRCKPGELIEQSDERNDDLKYNTGDVKGISIQKIFIETNADMSGVSWQRLEILFNR